MSQNGKLVYNVSWPSVEKLSTIKITMNEVVAGPVNKVKPYTVYDLSTRSVLSDEEINKCLIQASEKELLKKTGEYGLVYDIAKPNGDAPNCIALPAKNRSKSFSVLPNHYETKITGQESDYDDIPFRVRSNTAPANYDTALNEVKKPINRASRLVQPSSPGCAKRKIQQKLQRDGKQQIPSGPRLNQSGTSSLLVKPSASLRIPNSKIALPQSNSTPQPDQQSVNTGIPKSKPDSVPVASRKLPTPEFRKQGHTSRISPPNKSLPSSQRSVPRLSQTNSDGNSSDKSSIVTKNIPVTKTQSVPYGLKKSSPTAAHSDEFISTKSVSGIPNKKGIPQRTLSALDNKRSLDSLRMSRENTAENLPGRKTSTSSIPSVRSKQSSENLTMSRENTADSLRKPSQSALTKGSCRRSSVDGSTTDRNAEKPGKSSLGTTGISKLKQPAVKSSTSSSAGSTNLKSYSGLKPPEDSKLKKPATSTVSPGIVHKTGILKPAATRISNGETAHDESVDKPTIKPRQQLGERRFDKSPSSIKPSVHHRSDSTPTKETSPLTKSALPKKLSEPCTSGKLRDGMNGDSVEYFDHNQKGGLRYPTVGKIAQEISSRVTPPDIKMNESPCGINRSPTWKFHRTQKDSAGVSSEDEASLPSSQSSTPSPVYKLDIPSPDDEVQSSDSITYPYRSQNMTHQNVELILAERKQLTKMSDNESGVKVCADGYAEPEDRIKVCTNGYKVPLDNLDDQHKPRFDENTHNSSNIINRIEDPFEKTTLSGFSTDLRSEQVASPYKRIQPKVAIPPPQLSSLSTKGEFSPLPVECMRTPSSDGEEFLLNCHTEMDVIRRKAREQAIKAWNKNISVQETSNEDFDGSSRENLDSDVFYPNDAGDSKDQAETFALRSSIRRASDENIPQSMKALDDGGDQLKTMTLGRDKKKKSKFKKFFQKLSSKKDGKDELSTDYIDHETPSIEDYRTSIRLNNGKNRLLNDGRRKSDGAISIHSIRDSYVIGQTPSSKRRMFLFNLSFLRKGRRLRANTYCNDTSPSNNKNDSSPQLPSDTIRALCSPDIDRRNRLITTRLQRRGSDPSIYRVNQPLIPSTKKYRAPQPPTNIPPYAQIEFRSRVSNSSVSSMEDEANYINYPFSKSKILPPQKPQRHQSKGSCSSEPFTDKHSTVADHTEKKNHTLNEEDAWRRDTELAIESLNKSHRLSSNSSDSALSSESLSSSQRSNTFSMETTQQRNSSSLRRTPLRHSIDSYNKLIEVHRQTIEKIAYETSRLYCDCDSLHGFDWDDFESVGENIQLGLTNYMVVPVNCNLPDGQVRRYTAWLQMEHNSPKREHHRYPNINYSKTTLHRNCLHLCHSIEQTYATPLHDGIPKAININHVYISPQLPKMTLAKYASLTLDKHSRHPEIYEREIALIFLQVMKGVQHFYRNGVFLSGVQAENLVILSNGEPSVVLSPRRVPNKCPVVAIAVLPNLGESFQKTEYNPMTSICHQLAFVLYELLHTSYHDELKDAVDITMLLATLPDLTIKSIYSRHLQCIINMLLNSTNHTNKSFDDIRLMLEVLLFGPTDLSDHKDDAINLISKWYNRRCVDMVTHILKEASLVVLRASGCVHEADKVKSVDQELLLECEFLADSTPADIYRISKMLNR